MNFHDLHAGPTPLLLPNAWDVASALAFVEAGFPAVGTTSFGVSAATGAPDAGRTSRTATVRLVKQLRALPAYVTADIEDGYSDDAGEVAAFVAGLGVAGVNIEDSTAGELIDPAAHAAKVAAIKKTAPDVFVNARVETYWLGKDATVEATLHRARAYVDAGADGIFVPSATDPHVLELLVAAIPLPVNVLVVPDLTLQQLGSLGIRRVSTGSLPYRAAIDAAVTVATAVRDGRTVPSATPYPEAQRRLEEYADRLAGQQ
jgi:2-methylisocitrate lyase-like PEP mutase family enzyme